MGLKRREGRSYSVEEMMNIINKDFIKRGGGSQSKRVYVISSTCFQNEDKRFLMCDSRDEESAEDEEEPYNLLQPYYGRTISSVVTKCFLDRANHG